MNIAVFGLIIMLVGVGLLLLDRSGDDRGLRPSKPCPTPKGPIPNPFHPEPRCDCCPRCGRIKTPPPRSPRPSVVNSSSRSDQ